MAAKKPDAARSTTGIWPARTGEGNKRLKPSVTPSRIAAVRLANLKKLLPMLRGEMKSSVSIMPTPSCENRKKIVDEITDILRWRDGRGQPCPRLHDRSAQTTSRVPCAYPSVYGFRRYCCWTMALIGPLRDAPELPPPVRTCRWTDNK